MRKLVALIVIISMCFHFAAGQAADSLRKVKDSTLRALFHEDSLKVEKQFSESEQMEKLFSKLQYPVLNIGKYSGIIPVKDPTEIPDPNIDYKLLFELTYNNPDSIAKDINAGLTEIARVINLHVASGVPLKRIIPVIIVHGSALDAISNNQAYQKKHKMDNPNIQAIESIEKITGAKFIACGQAMAFFGLKKDDLLPDIKISLTAQTVLSHYQLKGYVLYKIDDMK